MISGDAGLAGSALVVVRTLAFLVLRRILGVVGNVWGAHTRGKIPT